MDTFAGISYACYTNYKYLREREYFSWNHSNEQSARDAWAVVWEKFVAVGLKATVPAAI